MRIEFDRGYVDEPFVGLVADFPDQLIVSVGVLSSGVGPGLSPWPSRRQRAGVGDRSGPGDTRGVHSSNPGRRGRATISGVLDQARDRVVVRVHQHVLVLGVRPSGGEQHVDDPAIADYRHRWIDAIVASVNLEAIITLGHLADSAYQQWRQTPSGAASTLAYATVLHPTYPDSASRSGTITKAQAFAKLCASWNTALQALHPVVTPDVARPLVLYGSTITNEEHSVIPAGDLPAGLPAWMRSLDAWAKRTGPDAQTKRATLTVTVPRTSRTWPIIN